MDILFGKQTREHQDIDIILDSSSTSFIIAELKKHGYEVKIDLRPQRVKLFHPKYGLLDIHPFKIGSTIMQEYTDGVQCKITDNFFGEVDFEGRNIPCITLEGQRAFHKGDEFNDHFNQDLDVLRKIEVRMKQGT